jgi:hypothetical protein
METHERRISGEALQELSQAHGVEVRWPGMHAWRLPDPRSLVVQWYYQPCNLVAPHCERRQTWRLYDDV